MFLTRVGHMCDDKRQEFILLSDTLGISMLVDAINHRQPEGATETTVLGPFYVQDPPVLRARRRHLARRTAAPRSTSSASVTDARRASRWPAHSSMCGSPTRTASTTCSSPGDDRAASARGFITDADGAVRASGRSCRTYYPIPDDGPVGDMLDGDQRATPTGRRTSTS